MKIRTADLKFEKLEGDVSALPACNYCGLDGFRFAVELRLPNRPADAFVVIGVCSEKCADLYKTDPHAQFHLDGLLDLLKNRLDRFPTNNVNSNPQNDG